MPTALPTPFPRLGGWPGIRTEAHAGGKALEQLSVNTVDERLCIVGYGVFYEKGILVKADVAALSVLQSP